MEINRETLAKSYSEMSDAELLNLHSDGIITEIAYEVLEAELSRREIDIPDRPPSKEEQLKMAAEMLAQHYSRKSDEDLIKLIEFSGNLTLQSAQFVAMEIKERGLQIPENLLERLRSFVAFSFLFPME